MGEINDALKLRRGSTDRETLCKEISVRPVCIETIALTFWGSYSI